MNMMNFYGKRARSVTPYTAGEQPDDRPYIKLNANENPFPPSPRVAKLLKEFDCSALSKYPSADSRPLRFALAAFHGVPPEYVFCSNGSDETLAFCFAAFFDDERAACFADVTYSFYPVFASFFGAATKIVPLSPDFAYDLKGMRETDCAGYFLAVPNAPTGIAPTADELEDFIASVPDRLVVVDEAYMDFCGESIAPLTGRYKNLLVVRTFSKSYSLAGARVGYAVGDPALIEGLSRMRDCFNSYPVDSLAAEIARAALSDTEYHKQAVQAVVSERERLRGALIKLGFTVPESKANFLFAGRGKLPAETVMKKLKERGVLVRWWNAPRISDFCRITVGTDVENDRLISELQRILGS